MQLRASCLAMLVTEGERIDGDQRRGHELWRATKRMAEQAA